jgi:multidrug resistance efflux pump
VAGFVDEIPVDRGSRVRKGDLLLTLSAPELSAQLAESEAKVLAIESEKAEAKTTEKEPKPQEAATKMKVTPQIICVTFLIPRWRTILLKHADKDIHVCRTHIDELETNII